MKSESIEDKFENKEDAVCEFNELCVSSSKNSVLKVSESIDEQGNSNDCAKETSKNITDKWQNVILKSAETAEQENQILSNQNDEENESLSMQNLNVESCSSKNID